ncbi:helix-turn-helix transcriptional regulator [Desulfitobacterium metallireducens]|uniref:Transcriptional regulator n=1 Tax=Desulfitobacterium metallireducens DSM 15288 TaxID=871968 RepID=W0E6A5_9FIRM|nr:WYL domain-containing protein [Desulfitobacterium metallireducens]AHF06405.1 transcriptional regulator [Desulfitobacterium metallireducens DSM 15288]
MNKVRRQTELIKLIAKEPWQHTQKGLAERFLTSEATVKRDLVELAQKEYIFAENDEQELFLQSPGWCELTPLKEATLRQMEILELLQRFKAGLTVAKIEKLIHSGADGETGEKTVERMVKDLVFKGFVTRQGNVYCLNPTWILPPLQLNEREKQVFYEALKLTKALSPLPEVIPALEAKLNISLPPHEEIETVLVQGRTPSHNMRRIHICNALVQAARSHQVIKILYRREGEETVQEVRVYPLGIVYYWVLDKWYLATKTKNGMRTYVIDQILHLDQEEEHFEGNSDFDLKTYYGSSWGIYRCATPTEVKIRFYRTYSTLQRVREELQGRVSCQLEEDEEGLILTDRVDGIAEIAVWLRGFGSSAQVLEPPELRERMREEWARMYELYGKEGQHDFSGTR